MNTQYFYLNILRNKLGLPLEVRKPIWFIRIIDNVVDGEDYANFLCLDVKHNVTAQLLQNSEHHHPVLRQKIQ